MSQPAPETPELTVDEAQERILASFRPLPATEVSLDAALGMVIAASVTAGGDLPPFDNSAMDGYALRFADTAGASNNTPVELRVMGQAPAGHLADTSVEPGTALRIMTGAPIPPGADAVIRFEHVIELARDRIAIPRAVGQRENIRPAGEDARQGQPLLVPGTRIRPNE
ncbi:MAG TPA: molybdopterin molybdenumtransferase MoeA, partial [Thermomicrobiales bacterium]|nr:molybdopterin molybdenumtransferase MoeA [Thermomicrobiales bacterium]